MDNAVPFPFREQPHNRIRRLAKLRRSRVSDSGHIPSSLDHRHLHTKADSKIRDLSFSGKLRGHDLAFSTALAKATGHQNTVNVFKLLDRATALKTLGLQPFEVHLHIVG